MTTGYHSMLFLVVWSLSSPVLYAQRPGQPASATVLVRISGKSHDFSRFSRFAASSHGALAVAQVQDGRVHIFHPDGSVAASVGRLGSGPGEFREIRQLGWTGDTAWVVDNANNRITLIAGDGKVVRMTSLPVGLTEDQLSGGSRGFRRVPTVIGRYPDGSLLFSTRRQGPPIPSAGSGTFMMETWLLRGDPDGTLRKVVAPGLSDQCTRYSEGEGSRAVAMLPLCPSPMVAHASDGSTIVIVAATSDDAARGSYTVTALSVNGDTLFSHRVSVPLVRVPSAIRDTLIQGQKRETPAVRALIQGSTVPQLYPPVRRVAVGVNGDIWLNVRVAGDSVLSQWHVFDWRGNGPAVAWLPREAAVFAVERRGMWATEVDYSGIESIVLYARPRP